MNIQQIRVFLITVLMVALVFIGVIFYMVLRSQSLKRATFQLNLPAVSNTPTPRNEEPKPTVSYEKTSQLYKRLEAQGVVGSKKSEASTSAVTEKEIDVIYNYPVDDHGK